MQVTFFPRVFQAITMCILLEMQGKILQDQHTKDLTSNEKKNLPLPPEMSQSHGEALL